MLVFLALPWRALAFEYARDPKPALTLGSLRAGTSPMHRLSVEVLPGELETYRAILTYPRGFRFHGFDVLGPANTPIGAYEVDFNFDGVAEFGVPVRSLTPGSAYVDVLTDGVFSAGLEPVINVANGTEVQLHLPSGGDANSATRVVEHGARLSLTLFPGIMANPDVGGAYTVAGRLNSVDPDTDGADDGAGEPPQLARFAIELRIAHVPFGEFEVLNAQVKLDGGTRDRFMVLGHRELGRTANGTNLATEDVTVTFGPFRQRIPGHAFSATGDGVLFTDKGPGVKHLKLGADGRFRVDARDLALHGIDPNRPVRFTLQIGDDLGETPIAFDRNGHCGPQQGSRRCAP
jgi:hypothetical protein